MKEGKPVFGIEDKMGLHDQMIQYILRHIRNTV